MLLKLHGAMGVKLVMEIIALGGDYGFHAPLKAVAIQTVNIFKGCYL